MAEKYKLNQYRATCEVCGQEVDPGAGQVYKGQPYQDDLGYWHSGKFLVRHIAKCSPTRIRIVFAHDRVVGVAVDGKAVVILETVVHDKSTLTIFPYEEMHSGMILSFDMALHDIQKEDK